MSLKDVNAAFAPLLPGLSGLNSFRLQWVRMTS